MPYRIMYNSNRNDFRPINLETKVIKESFAFPFIKLQTSISIVVECAMNLNTFFMFTLTFGQWSNTCQIHIEKLQLKIELY